MIVLVKINVFLIISGIKILQIQDYIIIAENHVHKSTVDFNEFVKRKVAVVNQARKGFGQDFKLPGSVTLQVIGDYFVMSGLQKNHMEVILV